MPLHGDTDGMSTQDCCFTEELPDIKVP